MRLATLEDYNAILKMVRSFAENSPYSKIMNYDKIEVLLNSLLVNNGIDTVILIDEEDRGFIAGIVSPHFFFEGKIATELAWWVEPEDRNSGVGRELLTSFEEWAWSRGCSNITMISLDDNIGKFYEDNGYVLQERAYLKSIVYEEVK